MNTSLLKHPATVVWGLLMMATGFSWWLGADGLALSDNLQFVTTMLIIIAFVKVRFVIHYFMEVRSAPLALRLVCDGWVIGVCLAILALY
jgi:cytochrome c oxidase subunit IV